MLKIQLIDELDCGLDFFVLTDGRYEYRPKDERENTNARNSPRSGCDLLNLDSCPSNAFDTMVSAVSQNTNQSSKSAQSIRNF